jgi:Toxin with a conserved tryptophan and TIP tripeptide motif
LSADKWDVSIPGEVNEWHPTQEQARLAAQAFALELDINSLPPGSNLPPISVVASMKGNVIRSLQPPRHWVSGPEAHDFGLPHYHVYGPTGKIEGHFFFGDKPPRKEKSLHEYRERAKERNDYKRTATVVGAAAGGTLAVYLAYRAIRMLPSLAPPLWWTIPANVAIP